MWPLAHVRLPAGAVELSKIANDTTLVFQPSVFLANALAAFALNLVRWPAS